MQIQISRSTGRYDGTCTLQSNLVANYMAKEVYREVMTYTEGKLLSTLLTNLPGNPWTVPSMKPKIKVIDESKGIGSNTYRFRKMGQIHMASVIDALVGTPGLDGTFTLRMKDDYLHEGNVCTFWADWFQARVMSNPQGVPGNYIVHFQSVDYTVFDAATHINGQIGEKTCFGGYTAYEERSHRGYNRTHYGDEYLNYMTIQRKSFAFSGDALTQVVKYDIVDTDSKRKMKAWDSQVNIQARITWALQNDFHKMFGKSNMIDADGNAISRPKMISRSTGEEIYMGMSLEQQISGENDMYASGADGAATTDDFTDMLSALSRNSDDNETFHVIFISGTDGYANAQVQLRDLWKTGFNGQSPVTATAKGGQEVGVGYEFTTLNFAGDYITFVKYKKLDDARAFPARTSGGKLAKSMTYYCIDATVLNNGDANIEILYKELGGINRSNVSIELNGITGASGTPVNEVDAKTYAMLKQDMLIVYRTETCGMIKPM